MAELVLGQHSYRRGDGLVPSANLLNVFFERAPTNLKDQVALLTRPALKRFLAIGTGPIRGVFREDGVFNGDAMVVSGPALYRVNPAGTAVLVGGVPGTGIVEMAFSTDTALIANGGQLLATDGVTVTIRTDAPSSTIQSVGFIDGYFLMVPVDSHRMYYIHLLTGLFDVTRFISAERYPDNIRKLVVTSDEVWAMGDASAEVFVPTGIDTSEQPPFQRVEGRLYKKGLSTAASAVPMDNTVYWVGESNDGGLAVYKGDAVPIQVSDPTVGERLKRCDLASITAWAFGNASHVFYVLGLGSEGTWAYDVGAQAWFEWGSLNRSQWRAHLGRGVWNGAVLAGDDEEGVLWSLDETLPDDDGTLIKQIVTAGAPIDGLP
jgi:hypothetical protein